MTFWDGTRWIDQSKRQLSPRPGQPRGRAARLTDIIATFGMILILGALFVPFTPALATGPSLTVSPSSGAPGSTIQVVGTAFRTGSKVQVAWDGSGSGMPVAQPNGNGSFKASIIVPAGSSGAHTISAAQVLSKRSKAALLNSTALAGVSFTVTQADGSPDATPADTGTGTAAPVQTSVPDPTLASGETPVPGDTPAATATDQPTSGPTDEPTPRPTARPTPEPIRPSIRHHRRHHGRPRSPPLYQLRSRPRPLRPIRSMTTSAHSGRSGSGTSIAAARSPATIPR